MMTAHVSATMVILIAIITSLLVAVPTEAILSSQMSQCPAFVPCLSPSRYRDYQFARNDTTSSGSSRMNAIYGNLHASSNNVGGGSGSSRGGSPFALECSIRGREALVTPLFGHRITTDDVSPLRRLGYHGYTRIPEGTAGGVADMDDPYVNDDAQSVRDAHDGSSGVDYLSMGLDRLGHAFDDVAVGNGYVASTIVAFKNILSPFTETFGFGVENVRAVINSLTNAVKFATKRASSAVGGVGEEDLEDNTLTAAAFAQKVNVIGRSLAHKQTWARLLNTFLKHIPRIFGRVVTRIEYSLESNENRQFISTLKMFIVKPKRVVPSVEEEEALRRRAADEDATTDDPAVEDTLRAAATAAKTYGALPLSCEAWEAALNERLLHSQDAPDKDLYPDAESKRLQLEAIARRAKEEGLVEEVCRPFRQGWLPPWLQAKFAWSGTESSTQLMSVSPVDVCGDDAFDDDETLAVDGIRPSQRECEKALEDRTTQFRCEVSVPVASHSCLVVESLYRNKNVAVSIAQSHVWDTSVIGFAGFLVAIAILKPILVTNKFLQIGAAGALGIFFVLLVAVWYIVKDLRKTKLGSVGIIAMVTAGGILSFSETVTSMLWYYLTVESRTNPYIQATFGIAAIGAAIVSRFFFYDRVPTITHYSLTALQIATWVALCSHNREAAALIALVVLLGRIRSAFTFALATSYGLVRFFVMSVFYIVFGPIVVPYKMYHWFVKKITAENNEPRDSFPMAATQAQAYVRPMVSEGIYAPTAEAKFRAYEQQGSEHTRKALAELAKQIRANPSILSRVQDPNGVGRFAGAGDESASDRETSQPRRRGGFMRW